MNYVTILSYPHWDCKAAVVTVTRTHFLINTVFLKTLSSTWVLHQRYRMNLTITELICLVMTTRGANWLTNCLELVGAERTHEQWEEARLPPPRACVSLGCVPDITPLGFNGALSHITDRRLWSRTFLFGRRWWWWAATPVIFITAGRQKRPPIRAHFPTAAA